MFGRSIGPLHIFSYGVFLALSFLAGLFLFVRDGRKAGLKTEDQLDQMIYIIIFSIIGARILYVFLSRSDYSSHPLDALKIYQGGLSYHGGAVGGVFAVFFFSWRKKIPGWLMADTCIRPLILGSAIARIGCFLNGCCYGHEWHGPWAVTFPSLQDGIPRHPTQFYDLGLHLILLGVITFASRFKKRDSDISAFYLFGFAVLRFITEITRSGATAKVLAFGLTQAQTASLGIFSVGLFIYFFRRNSSISTAREAASKKNGASGKTGQSGKKSAGKKK